MSSVDVFLFVLNGLFFRFVWCFFFAGDDAFLDGV